MRNTKRKIAAVMAAAALCANYKYTADFDKRYTFDIEKFLNHRMKLKASEEYEVVEADDVSEETAEPKADD